MILLSNKGWQWENSFHGVYFVSNKMLASEEDVYVLDDFGTLKLVPNLSSIFVYMKQEH